MAQKIGLTFQQTESKHIKNHQKVYWLNNSKSSLECQGNWRGGKVAIARSPSAEGRRSNLTLPD
jgi:hypothetical protein